MLVLAVQALKTCSLTASTGKSSTASCIMPREGYLKTVAFLAAPRKFTLLLLVPVSNTGDLSSEDEESETVVVPAAPGKSKEEEALLAPPFLFFFAAFDLAFFLLFDFSCFGCFQLFLLLSLSIFPEAAIAPPADAITIHGIVG